MSAKPTLRWLRRAGAIDWEAEYHRLMRACVLIGHVPPGTWPIARTIELGKFEGKVEGAAGDGTTDDAAAIQAAIDAAAEANA